MGVVGDFLRALGQLGDRRFRAVVLRGLGLTLGLLAGLGALLVAVLRWLIPDVATLPLIGDLSGLDAAAALAGILAMLGLSVVLMVPVAAAFTGLFLDEVSDAVEARHYPHLPPAPGTPILVGLAEAARLMTLTLVLNLVGLGLFAVIGPLAPVLFWAINGWLLGREFFMQVALRRLPRAQAAALRRRHGGQVWLAGTLMAVALSLPLFNLLVPVLAAASFTHSFARLAGRAPQPANA